MSRFFETKRPKPFHIEPRYWDPKKEEREARERRINAELGIENKDGYKPYIGRGEFRRGFTDGKWSPQSQRRKSNTRLLVLLILAAGLIYFMLK